MQGEFISAVFPALVKLHKGTQLILIRFKTYYNKNQNAPISCILYDTNIRTQYLQIASTYH